MSHPIGTDPLAEYYDETMRLIQQFAMEDVPRYLRPKPWPDEKFAAIGQRLATGARMAAAEKSRTRRAV